MKRIIAVLISLVMIMCIFTSGMPSFALSDSDFTYEIVDEKIIITGYNGINTAIVVPAQINDIPVAAIGEGAFKNNASLTSVTLSSGIEDVRASAFENCTKLATISLPVTITHIGEKAIYNTAYYNNKSNWKLKRNNSSAGDVNIGGSGMDTISWEDIAAPLLQYLYLGKNLIEIEYSGIYTVKSGTLVIADSAAVGSTGAKEIIFPQSLVTVGCNAFYGCESLNSVKNLNVVQNIGDSAFEGCVALETLDISETALWNASAIYNTGFYNNPENWTDGALYMGTRLVGTDENSSETVVCDGATHIIGESLADKDAVIPASVSNIADNAFIATTNVKIFGYSGTYAETYADEHSIPFIDLENLIMGDVDFNGVVDDNDYEILCGVAGLTVHQSYAISIAGDLNEDGAVDGFDVVIFDLFRNEMGPSTLKGDANGDGEITEADYNLLIQISTGKAVVKDNFMFDRCDLNGDGAVDGFDAIYLDLVLNGYLALL